MDVLRDSAEQPPVLSVGVVFGGTPEVDAYWRPELSTLMKQVIQAREGVTSPLCLNVVFHVDGRLLAAGFEGVRTGVLVRRSKHLMVQAATPGVPVEDSRPVVVQLLHEAVDAAEVHAARRSIADGLPGIRTVLSRLPL